MDGKIELYLLESHYERGGVGGAEGCGQAQSPEQQLEGEVCVGGLEEGLEEPAGQVGGESRQTQSQSLHLVRGQ